MVHTGLRSTTEFTRIKMWNITNNNIVPVDQAGREQFLGNAISGVLWGNNMTNIGPAIFHLAGNCVRYWIRYCREHKHSHYPLHTQQFRVPEDVIGKGTALPNPYRRSSYLAQEWIQTGCHSAPFSSSWKKKQEGMIAQVVSEMSDFNLLRLFLLTVVFLGSGDMTKLQNIRKQAWHNCRV